jgi:hypothetical protein
MRIWNLTPHPIHYDDDKTVRTFESDGFCRVVQTDKPAEPIDAMATVLTEYGGVEGIPAEVKPGDVLIVSVVVANALSHRTAPPGVTILVPDTGPSCRRDEHGRIISVCRFIRR